MIRTPTSISDEGITKSQLWIKNVLRDSRSWQHTAAMKDSVRNSRNDSMNSRIRYLNTDLDLVSVGDLRSLASSFKSRGVFALDISQSENGLWYARFETEESYNEPEPNIRMMLDVAESLPLEQSSIWLGCSVRDFNIGYECGTEPWAFEQGLSPAVLARIAALNASLRWTIYPHQPEAVGRTAPTESDIV